MKEEMNIIGQERSWKTDTNHERFRVVKLDKIVRGIEYYTIEYFTTNGRKQCQDKQTILEKSILLEPEENFKEE